VQPTASEGSIPTSGSFTLSSTAFEEGGAIPRDATCDGSDQSPALAWTGIPAGTTSLVLYLDDPDARGFVHWTVLDLAADASGSGSLATSVDPGAASPQQGRNDFGRVGYGGPCPPSGTHRYRFELSALAAPLGLAGHPTGADVRAALDGAEVLGRTVLNGTYARR
jgi:Raf kinase inhibitor-like YbhB/YbcL family protein